MIITCLESISKRDAASYKNNSRTSTAYKVHIDGGFAFLLYQKEIDFYGLKEGEELTKELYEEILQETVYRRAKQKALGLLKYMDRTKEELRRKLREASYPEAIIEAAIGYVSEYGYLDDERYAENYINSRKLKKSRLAIETELICKGIEKDLMDKIFSVEYGADRVSWGDEPLYPEDKKEDPELTAIKKAVHKKCSRPEELSWEEKQKLIASLCRKGFGYDKIRKIFD